MIFLLDVHLPRRLVAFIQSKRHEAIHVLDVLSGGRTEDTEIRQHADHHQYIVITKDKDFVTSHTFLKSPKKLIKINLGNLGNEELLSIFEKNWNTISAQANSPEFMIELDRVGVVLHEPRNSQIPFCQERSHGGERQSLLGISDNVGFTRS